MLVGFGIVIIWPNVYTADVFGRIWTDAFVNGKPVVEIYNLPLAFICALVTNLVVSLVFPTHPAEDTRASGA